MRTNSNFKLTIHKDSTTLNPSNYKWDDGSVTVEQGKDSLIYSKANVDDLTFTVKGDSQLIQIIVHILERPRIVFDKKDKFNWEYGWDDISYKQALLAEDFPNQVYGGKNYIPKWMSVFHQKTVEVKVDIQNFNTDFAKIKDFYIYIKSNNSKIKINNDTAFKVDYNTLYNLRYNTKKINIVSDELGSTITNHLRDSIVPHTKEGDAIGKLYISCEKPTTKKVIIVYAKTKNYSTYPTNINANLINFLNNKSYNQLLRQIDTNPIINGFRYPTELDVSNAPNIYNLSQNADSIHSLLKREYNKLFMINNVTNIPDTNYPINLDIINPNENAIDNDSISISQPNSKTRILYITDFSGLTDVDGSSLKGRGSHWGGSYTFITDIGQNEMTIIHELGHIFHLLHCFQAIYPNMPLADPVYDKSSNNFMDYANPSSPPDQRNMFYYYQWFHKSILNNGIGTAKQWIW